MDLPKVRRVRKLAEETCRRRRHGEEMAGEMEERQCRTSPSFQT
jgi:hypothetical protein